MKKILLLMAVMAFGVIGSQAYGQRYLTEVFTGVDVTSNVAYSTNITVLTGMPAMDTILCDIYEPTGDTIGQRPVVIVSHTGSFLPPPVNGQCTGNKSDYAVVELCNLLAKRGYVAVAMNYRLGWNPVGTQEERTGTLLNAAYRGIQDARTLVRFLRNDAANADNYGIDPDKIVVGGVGTGGYISLGCGYLDKYDEINLAKFIDPNTVKSYVDTSLSGDIEGKWNRPLNVGNYTSYSSEVNMIFNMGGAVGDSSWINSGESPAVSFHCPNDPFAPYNFGAVIVPTTQQFVVNVSGSEGVQQRANRLGLNDDFIFGSYSDPYTAAANASNNGLDGLFPFVRPTVESGPWEYFDSTMCPAMNVQASLQTNPDMSMMKANAYLDSIVNYLAPRMVCVLGLPGCLQSASTEPVLDQYATVFPNPASDLLNIRTALPGNVLRSLEVVDLSGRSVARIEGLTGTEYALDAQSLTPGLYFVKITTTNGKVTKKVIFE